MFANKKNNTSNRMYVSLLLLALLGAAATNHVADAVFAATPASPARDQGEGWYFREYAIEVGSNPGPGAGPGPLLATSPEYLRNFYPGSISLIGDLANVNVICPAGYHSAGCIGGTVPAGIGSVQLSGGLSTELAAGPGLLSSRPFISEGFNKFTGCGATVRFNYPIPRDYLYQSNYVFLKVEAYCQKDKHPKPTPKPPYVPPYSDPCDCAQQRAPLGCINTSICKTGTICYVDQRCPGFRRSRLPSRFGQFFKCVSSSECR